ncbi:MAG: YybS family protein [Bacillaceae bacterium]|nr:YybS family protein [Bacillaceae bacterium]
MKDVKSLTEGAILAALIALIVFLSFTVPFLGSLLIFAIPLPLVIYVTKYGWKHGLLLWLVASIVTLVIGGPVFILNTVFFGASGIVIGELTKRKKTGFTVLFGGSLVNICTIIIAFILINVVLDINIITLTQEIMYESFETAQQLLMRIGQDPGAQYDRMLQTIQQIHYIAPSLFIMMGTFYALIVQLIAIATLKRLRLEAPKFKPFREWSIPKAFLWYYVVTWFLLIMNFEEGSYLFIVTQNLLPIFDLLLTIQGLAFVFYYFHKKQSTKATQIIVMILTVLLLQVMLFIYKVLGIIDLGFELRKRLKNTEK